MEYTRYRYMRYTDRKGKWSKWHWFGACFVKLGNENRSFMSGISFSTRCNIGFILTGAVSILYNGLIHGIRDNDYDITLELSTCVPIDDDFCKNCNKNWEYV